MTKLNLSWDIDGTLWIIWSRRTAQRITEGREGGVDSEGEAEKIKERKRGDAHSLLRLSSPEKAPLVSSIVPEMSLWSSSLWRTREKRA